MTNEAIYQKLAEHLDRLPGGFDPSNNGADLRLLQRLFTPEEAELATYLTLYREEAQAIAKRASLPLAETEQRLNQGISPGSRQLLEHNDPETTTGDNPSDAHNPRRPEHRATPRGAPVRAGRRAGQGPRQVCGGSLHMPAQGKDDGQRLRRARGELPALRRFRGLLRSERSGPFHRPVRGDAPPGQGQRSQPGAQPDQLKVRRRHLLLLWLLLRHTERASKSSQTFRGRRKLIHRKV
jgi:hypothetical protein